MSGCATCASPAGSTSRCPSIRCWRSCASCTGRARKPRCSRLSAAAGSQRVRAYGEMVDLLWQIGDVASAIDLEARWNELSTTKRFSLLCAYLTRDACTDPRAHLGVLHQHSGVV